MASNVTTESSAPLSDPNHDGEILPTRAEVAPARPAPPGHGQPPAPVPRRKPLFKALLAVGAVIALVAFVVVRGPERAKADALSAWHGVYHFVMGPERSSPPPLAPREAPSRSFSGTLTVSKPQSEAIGLNVANVEPQLKPILLELTGTTDYDQNTLAKVRPLFDARVAHVFRSVGEMVKKGDPLVELYSADLTTAKIDFRAKYAQWLHDKTLLDSRRPLAVGEAISKNTFLDTYLAEISSRVAYFGARDKLLTYGISPEEILRLQGHIDQHPNPKDPASDSMKEQEETKDEVRDISKLILKAPIDGMIVERDCVAGNFYDDMAVVMVISPMDKLWVWGDVYEKDQADVHLGQTWEVSFPNLDIKVAGKIEHIAARFDTNTRTLKIRASIPNPNSKLKADQRVRATLEIPALPGQTVIPRNAIVVVNGENCCFVQLPESPEKFRRVVVEIDQENHDYVVIRRGLSPNEKVVTNGSLILAQLYEDESTVTTGQPLQ
jgi:cobalt-zinc-cadmium efflux system membrane fusion protein